MTKQGDPREILDKQHDPEYLKAFIERVQTPTTMDVVAD